MRQARIAIGGVLHLPLATARAQDDVVASDATLRIIHASPYAGTVDPGVSGIVLPGLSSVDEKEHMI